LYTWIDIDMSLSLIQRISYYEQALQNISSPSSFREQVLHNVYQCLLTNCRQQYQAPSVALRH